jgi:xanthine dehydrogenase molybdopterin-binding subunit B
MNQSWCVTLNVLHSTGRLLPRRCDAQRLGGEFKEGCIWTFSQLLWYGEAGKLSQLAKAASVLTSTCL